MENFIVSARKYRPASFDMVVGQQAITDTLKNAIKTRHLSQSYLFCGPRGVGKTTCARILAKTINCQNITDSVEACNECESCKSFNSSRSFSIHELDAASNNKVDDIRTLTDQVRIPPQVGNYSIYIIDEVHMLSTSAFNAFLKTLEEPPPHAIFILATTEKHKIIPTILSRCQIFDFHRITIDDISDRLAYVAEKEGIKAEKEGLHIIAQKADGAMRDALSIFDQIVSFSGKNITYSSVIENLNVLDYEYYLRITDAFLNHDVSTALLIFDEILNKGFDGHNFVAGLASHFRNLLVCKDETTLKLLEVGSSIRVRYSEQTAKCTPEFLFRSIDILGNCDINYKNARNQRLHVELGLIKLANVYTGKDKEKISAPDRTVKISNEEEDKKEESEKKETSQEVKVGEKVPEKKPAGNKVPEASSNKVSKRSHSFSIKEKLQDENEGGPKTDGSNSSVADKNEIYGTTGFDNEELQAAWQKFGETVKESSMRMSSIIKAMSPDLGDNYCITLQLKTQAQKEYIDRNYKQKMLDFLKRELDNSQITFVTGVSDEKDDSAPYTMDDKYKFLKEKNPAISKLRSDFSLDFD